MILTQKIIILLLFNLFKSIKSNEHYSKQENSKNYCRERNRLIESENGDLYTLIDGTIGQNLTFQCHFCNENDDGRPKIWYKSEHLPNKTLVEVKLDMNNDKKMNKIHINSEHSLILNNFTWNDTGLYLCLYLEQYEMKYEKFNYFIDLIFDDKSNVISPEIGNFTNWRQYHQDYFMPINLLFQESDTKEFVKVRNDFHLKMEIITQWLPWGICEVCGRPNTEGIRKRIGLCRIKLTKSEISRNSSHNSDEDFLLNANAISCRSQLFSRLFPGISNLTRIIPNFVQNEPCQGLCNPDAQGLAKGWQPNQKTFAFKYRKRFVLNEGENLIIVCPESTLENMVIWRKGLKILKPDGEDEDETEEPPHVFVDTFSILYFSDIRVREKGNYSCEVDNVKMQQITINVISKSKIITQMFVRHLIYLGIILLLTTFCYCAGIAIAVNKRSRFTGYYELKQMDEENDKYEF